MESIDAPDKAVPNERRKEGSIPLHTAIDAPRGSQRRTPKTLWSYMKMSSGSRALTSRFGTSTTWLMRRSTATLHKA